MPNKEIDITGQKYGMLTALCFSRFAVSPSRKYSEWIFRCDCGQYTRKRKADVMRFRSSNNTTANCGCLTNFLVSSKVSLPYGEAAFRCLYDNYKNRSSERGLAFDLTLDYFRQLTQQNCFYCNKKPSQTIKRKNCNGDYIYNGVDRVDNKVGYLKSNAVTCCWTCNQGKGKLSKEDFLQMVIDVTKNLKLLEIHEKQT